MPSDLPEKFIPVSEVERLSGASYHTLRYYTKIGLLPYMTRRLPYPGAPSTVGHYPDSVLETLKKIAELKKQGLPNEEIKKRIQSPVVPSTQFPVTSEPVNQPTSQPIPPPPPPIPPSLDPIILGEERKHNDLLNQIFHFLTNMIRVPLPAREPTWAKVVSHGLTLALVFGTIAVLALGFSDLTHARIRRMFSGFWDQYIERIIPGEVLGINQILDPIIDTNDVLEYKEFNATRWLHSKLPFLFDTGRFLGTVFFGETDNYFISPLGDASFRDLKARSVVANSVGAGSGEFGSIDVETINVGNLTVSSTKLVQNLNVDQLDNFDGSYYLDLDNETGSCSNCLTTVEIDESTLTIAASNADTLDSLDSTQFLRSDTSDNYTSGTLTINAGTILSVAGDLTIADTNISFTGGNTTFDFAAAATRTLTITNSNGANVANLSVEGDVSGNTLTSTVATGTAPLTVASTTLVANLNADLLDDQEGSYYLDWLNFTNKPTIVSSVDGVSNNEGDIDLIAGANITITPNDLANTITFDIDSSGLDADTLDGLDSLQFLRSDTSDNYTSGTLTFDSGTILLIDSGGTLSVDGEFTTADTTLDFTGGNTTIDLAAAALRTLTITNSNGANVANLSVEGDVSGNTLTSTVATGTAPLTVASTTLVANLNADLLDGQTGSYYLDLDNETGTCSNCLTTTEIDESTFTGLNSTNIDDIYLFNTGDTATGDYDFDSGTLFVDSANDLIGIGDTGPDAKLEVLSTTEQLRLTNVDSTTDARFTVSATGDLTLDMLGSGTTDQLVLGDTDILNIGSGIASDVAYNLIANAADAPEEAAISSDNDLYIGGDLEVDGTIYGNISGSAGNVAWSAITDPTTDLTLNHGTNTTTFDSAVDTATFFTINANSLTSGKGLSLASTSTALTGNLAEIVLSGSNAANTGNLLLISQTGALSAAVPLMVTNLGTGLSFRVNDETGDADATPFVIDASGNVGIGTTAPDAALEINHATGDSLRLTYNDSNGSAANYTDFSLSSTGALTLTGSAATLADSATAEKTFLTLTPGTITLTGTTAVTSVMDTAIFTGATIAASSATTVNDAAGLSLTAPVDSTNTTLTRSAALRIRDTTSGAGTLTSLIGLYLAPQTGGATNNYGICFDCDGTWSSSTVASGIQFGTDGNAVNLYRSASDTLRTDDSLTIGGGTITLSVDTNVVLSGGTNGISFDTDVLTVDATNNSVGILTNAPVGNFSVNTGGANDNFYINEDASVGVELRSGSALGTPYIDFSNDNTSDYDIRLQLTGDSTIDISGCTGGTSCLTVDGGAGKIDVGTIDPIFTIGGTSYATYVASMTGVKEETTGTVTTSQYIAGVGYRKVIDFKTQEKGSDLWLFSKATDLKNQIGKMVVLLSPTSNSRTWWKLDRERYTLTIFSSLPTRVAYRLTAPRFDADSWSNYSNGTSKGFVLEDEPLTFNASGGVEGETSPNSEFQIVPSKSGDGFFLVDQLGRVVELWEAFSRLTVANIQAGKIISPVVEVETLKAGTVTSDRIQAKVLEAKRIEVEELLVGGRSLGEFVRGIVKEELAKLAIAAPVAEPIPGTIAAFEKITSEEGIFEKLTVNAQAFFAKITAEAAKITTAFVENLTTKRLTVQGETIGEGVLPAGETQLLIANSLITEDSKVFVTPKVAVAAPLAVIDLKPDESFTVAISQPQTVDLPFSWWIVESRPLTGANLNE